MSEVLTFPSSDVAPSDADVCAQQGMPPTALERPRVAQLLETARRTFDETCAPRAVVALIARDEFAALYVGQGRNDERTPVGEIYGTADALYLFAATVGAELSQRVQELFRTRDYAAAAMLDALASQAADNLANRISVHVNGTVRNDTAALPYSPGYCGWHISGQRALFDFLRPEQIDITLNDAYLMQPLKSVSGVVLIGRRDLHSFEDDYEFCTTCRTHSCRARLRALRAN